MMKTMINFIFYIGFLFFGGGFLIAFGQFILYNGIGDIFEYKKADNFYIGSDTISMPAKLTYQYTVDEIEYFDYQNVSVETAKLRDKSMFTVLYNESFNGLSQISELRGRETKTWDQTVGMIVMGIPFLVIFLIYLFSDMDKWIRVYTKGEYKSSTP